MALACRDGFEISGQSRTKKNASCGSSSGSRAHTRHRRFFSDGGGLATSRFIGKPLPLDASKGDVGTAHVINAELADTTKRDEPAQ